MTLTILRGHPKVPVGGWHYSGHGQVFRGRDADEVIAALVEYRTRNSLPLGDPEADVAAYYAEMAPHLVRESGHAMAATNGNRQKVAEHTMAVWYGKYERKPSHDPIVNERIATCEQCPHLCHGFIEQETSYWYDAATKATLMTGKLDCAEHGWCNHHHQLVTLMTRLVSPDKVATLPAPDGCWLKTT